MTIIDMDTRPPAMAFEAAYTGRMNVYRFFEGLARAGIDMVCGVPLLVDSDHMAPKELIRNLNDTAQELVQKYPFRYICAVAVHPGCAEFSCREIEEGRKNGTGLVGDLTSAWLQDAQMQCAIDDILQCAQANGMTMSVRSKNVQEVETLARRFPALSLLVHFCGNVLPADIIALVTNYPQVHISLSVPVMMWNYVLHTLATRCAVEQLVFGTGYPCVAPSAIRAAVEWELRDQTEEVKRTIFCSNALRLAGRSIVSETRRRLSHERDH